MSNCLRFCAFEKLQPLLQLLTYLTIRNNYQKHVSIKNSLKPAGFMSNNHKTIKNENKNVSIFETVKILENQITW